MSEKPIADPKTIGTTYARQFSKPADAIDEQERAERRADLEEAAASGPAPHPAMVAFAEQEAAFLEEHATPEQRQARAFVDELEERGVVLGGTHFHTDDDDDATPEEHTALLAELQEPEEDQVIGTDENGDVVYQDRETGEEYVLA
jgi:hypothetical protein